MTGFGDGLEMSMGEKVKGFWLEKLEVCSCDLFRCGRLEGSMHWRWSVEKRKIIKIIEDRRIDF